MPQDNHFKYKCFLAFPHSDKFLIVKEAVKRGAAKAGFKIISPEPEQQQVLFSDLNRDININEIAQTDCIIADISNNVPNVYFQIGIAQAMGKALLIISQKQSLSHLTFDIAKYNLVEYELDNVSLDYLSKKISVVLHNYRKLPQRSSGLQGLMQYSRPFFIDWERLGKSEIENLCRELLSQMGFRHLQWGKMTPDIDLFAELPRKDPDGFEYRELWCISMGLRGSIVKFLDMAMIEPDYFIQRFLHYSESFGKSLIDGTEIPVTFLAIIFEKGNESRELDNIVERIENRRMKRGISRYNIRLRIWDQSYLSTLVHQFPQIGYKYFSDEGRYRSKTRKSYEDLYHENSELLSKQTRLIEELEDEKNRRVRAERDSIWKDISFSAAHKIGNPIFAIETDLDPLMKRIREQRIIEAEEVVKNIKSAVEKAKIFVEQFKSLARAQEIKPTTILLMPFLEDVSKALCNTGITCLIDCKSDIEVLADPDRLAECFDELIANAKHWFDKSEKKIEIKVISPIQEPIPDFLDSSSEYVLIRIKDNGCGIAVTNKQKIFDAFFTTYDHGTGLGLALVRRIIDGHGGGIIENGIPGKGADFEIYLPVPYLPKKETTTKQREKLKE